MRYQEGEFEFEDLPDTGTAVFFRRRRIGVIFSAIEANGRYCFRLGCDTRRQPRTYRGRVRAAEALKAIYELKRVAARQRFSVEEIIVRAWDCKPRTAPS